MYLNKNPIMRDFLTHAELVGLASREARKPVDKRKQYIATGYGYDLFRSTARIAVYADNYGELVFGVADTSGLPFGRGEYRSQHVTETETEKTRGGDGGHGNDSVPISVDSRAQSAVDESDPVRNDEAVLDDKDTQDVAEWRSTNTRKYSRMA